MARKKQHREETAPETPAETRRGFGFEFANYLFGAIVGLGPALIGLWSFFDPLAKNKLAPVAHRGTGNAKEGFVRVAALEALTVGGAPQRFKVIADRRDAWNYSPDQPIGAVYVERTEEQVVRVFNVTCPHAGCSVASNGTAYHCPCHNSSFELDGSKQVSETGRENPSPRSLDALEVDAEQLAKGEVWVKFQNYYTGIPKQTPKT